MDSRRANEGQGQIPEVSSHQQPQATKRHLTKEEALVLKQCGRDSFWYRCVPFAIGCILTVRVLAMRGVVKPHPRHGLLMKNMGAAFFGYFVGKASYVPVCQERIMKLENSPLAETLRRGKSPQAIIQEMTAPGYSEEEGARQQHSRLTDDYRRTDIDTDSNLEVKGLDDQGRPDMDRDVTKLAEESQSTKTYTTYDDLRRQNRAQYEIPTTPPTSQSPLQSSELREFGAPSATRRPATHDSDVPNKSGGRKSVRRNQYGDIIEDVDS